MSHAVSAAFALLSIAIVAPAMAADIQLPVREVAKPVVGPLAPMAPAQMKPLPAVTPAIAGKVRLASPGNGGLLRRGQTHNVCWQYLGTMSATMTASVTYKCAGHGGMGGLSATVACTNALGGAQATIAANKPVSGCAQWRVPETLVPFGYQVQAWVTDPATGNTYQDAVEIRIE